MCWYMYAVGSGFEVSFEFVGSMESFEVGIIDVLVYSEAVLCGSSLRLSVVSVLLYKARAVVSYKPGWYGLVVLEDEHAGSQGMWMSYEREEEEMAEYNGGRQVFYEPEQYRGWKEVEEQRFICIKLSLSPTVNLRWVLEPQLGTYIPLARSCTLVTSERVSMSRGTGVAGLMSLVGPLYILSGS